MTGPGRCRGLVLEYQTDSAAGCLHLTGAGMKVEIQGRTPWVYHTNPALIAQGRVSDVHFTHKLRDAPRQKGGMGIMIEIHEYRKLLYWAVYVDDDFVSRGRLSERRGSNLRHTDADARQKRSR